MILKNNNQIIENVRLINSPKFAYFYGYFVADGSFYEDSSGTRFEFSDGTSIKDELIYSFKFLSNVKNILEQILNKSLPNIRKKENKFVLSFRSKKLDFFFRKYFNLLPGLKTFSVDIPSFYKNTDLEKYFWLGYLDGDGMVARKNRKTSVESGSFNLIKSFKEFLKKENIFFKESKRILENNNFYRVDIKSISFRDFCSKLGFLHPRKRLWLSKHLETKDFYKNNVVNANKFVLNESIIDYEKIFNSNRVLIVNGKDLLKRYGLKHRGRKNRKFTEMLNKFSSISISKKKLFSLLSNYRWKMSKGSINSVKVPLYFNDDILNAAKFIRLRGGSISLSRNYAKSLEINPKSLINAIQRLFDISPKYTCRGEPIFCSGILEIFFSKIINNQEEKQTLLPKWHQNLV